MCDKLIEAIFPSEHTDMTVENREDDTEITSLVCLPPGSGRLDKPRDIQIVETSEPAKFRRISGITVHRRG